MTVESPNLMRNAQGATTVGRVHVQQWGDGTPVVLVHGSLATGTEEWEAQRPLAEEGFRLLVIDRRGYGHSPAAPGEDFIADADDIIELMGDGAHLVGHSYGGLGAMLAAARRPEAALSLTLLEAPVAVTADPAAAWQPLAGEVRELWDQALPDEEWVVRFLTAFGSDPNQFPPEFLAVAAPLVPVFRRGRPFFEFEPPLAELAAARFPKLVVSGGHSASFEAMCDALARNIGASRAVIEGAGHEIQFTGQPINEALLTLWRSAGEPRPQSH
jgi:pimeloyl-ACP methyl ester carboxylesterase